MSLASPNDTSRWFEVVPRDGLRFSWLESSVGILSITIHAMAIWIGITGEYIVHVPKWFDDAFGIPSMTSGTTRAIIAFDQGRFADAILFNPVGTVAAAFMAVFPLYLFGSYLRGRALVPTLHLRTWTTWGALAALLLCWPIKLLFVPQQYW